MATLYIAEGSAVGGTSNHTVAGMQYPPAKEQTVLIGASSATSQPFLNTTTMLQVSTDTTCSIAVGVNPTATNSNTRLSANLFFYITIPPNSGYSIAVIQNS